MTTRTDWEKRAREASLDGGKGILAIDFDDTLTAPGGVDALVQLRSRGYGLVVYTSNADLPGIQAWIASRWPETAGPPPPASHQKPQARAFIDDKAHRFVNWEEVLSSFP